MGGCDSSILQQREYSPKINSVLIKAGDQEGVKKRTRKHWEDIQQYDFSHKLDSIQTLKELENYEMRLAIANQWIGNNQRKIYSPKKIFCVVSLNV